ncbi:glutathione S-transferase family protein [Oceaniovalibus sp. ACAM 378]|uniref:glutathione S-transferase family protein n=1 Tax=Oceaniovalibus sp. ACAM 378 TaxID=2599923 RepID=UPI0011D489C2|nr:glutathione S-transferase family protein [Oceaniovalibus sp. ACAM 378]TYB86103.1 glutathione S-transferase family protein [Oceaniovalibus sp. ACAM 378]
MKLYGTPPTRALRAIWLINELEIDCEIVEVDMGIGEHKNPQMLALNPTGKLPVLVDGDDVISESCAIQLYLAEKFPEKGFMGANLSERGQIYRWMFFLATEIEQPLWRVGLHTRMYPEDERLAADVPLAKRDGEAMIAVLEDHMKDREFIVGDRLSVADFNAAYTLNWAREGGILGDAPGLNAYVERMYTRPKAPPTIEEAWDELKRQIA